MFERILVCLDQSELAECVLPYAVEEARRFQGSLTLLSVVHDPYFMVPGIPGVSGGSVEKPGGVEHFMKDREAAGDYLENIAGPIREQGIEVDTVVLQGAAGEAIVNYARENEDIGLIAIATHGYSGLRRVVFGSVAEHVLRHAGDPVLLIRAAPEED